MSYDIVQESVPPFVKRVGDHVTQGSNNTIIILGTDRAKKGPAGLGDGLGHPAAAGGGTKAGAIHIIAGRSDPAGDPDLDKDLSYVYLSMKSDPDSNLGLEKVEGRSGIGSTAVVKADFVRLVVRKDLKISLDGGSTYILLSKDRILLEGKKIEFGKTASKHLVRFEDMQKMYDGHIHNTATSVTSPPLPPNMKALEVKIATRLPNEILVSG